MHLQLFYVSSCVESVFSSVCLIICLSLYFAFLISDLFCVIQCAYLPVQQPIVFLWFFCLDFSSCQDCFSSVSTLLSAWAPKSSVFCLLFFVFPLLSWMPLWCSVLVWGGPAGELYCKVLSWLEGTVFQWRRAASNILFVIGREADLSHLLCCWHSDSLWLAVGQNDT